MREKIRFMPPGPPQRRRKIPPELTNRYVKDEAFIVVYRRILKITTKAANNLFCCDYFFIPTVAPHQRPHLSCQLSVWPRVSQQHLKNWYLILNTNVDDISIIGHNDLLNQWEKMLLWDSSQLCSPATPPLHHKYCCLWSKKMWKCLHVNVSNDEWKIIKV